MGDKVPIAEAEVKSESSPAPSPVADASPSTTSTSAAAVLSATTASTVAGPAPLATPPPLANSSFVKKEEEDAPAGDAPPGGTSPGDVDLDDVIKRLLQLRGVTEQSVLTEQELLHICERSRELLLAEPSFLKLDAPLKVCGDIHGQFMDLLRLLDYCGYPPNVKFLFLGDYVDRGPQSLEVITLLLAYKIKHPEHVYLLRGNHECQNICRVYGFYDQCKKQFNFKVWKAFVDVFNCLPFAALVDERIFCVHGGLSPHLNDLEELDRIKRPVDVVDETGMLCDCLWSDPDVNARGWAGNDRGVSHVFGPDIVKAFLEKFDLDLVVRAHQVVESGYEFFADRSLVTVFSAPNYGGEFENDGAALDINKDLICSFQVLKAVKKVDSDRIGDLGWVAGEHDPSGVPMDAMAMRHHLAEHNSHPQQPPIPPQPQQPPPHHLQQRMGRYSAVDEYPNPKRKYPRTDSYPRPQA